MVIFLWMGLALVGLKVIWNLGVPYALLSRLRSSPDGKTKSISVMFSLEWLMLGFAVALSALIEPEDSALSATSVASFGVLAIVVSYLHFVVASVLGGWIVTRLLLRNKLRS